MNILHINTFDVRGGAARAANRIHLALLNEGLNSSMLVSHKESDDISINEFVIPLHARKMWLQEKLLHLQKSKNPTHHSCNIFSSGIVRNINNSNADIVHLHWISNELISIKEVAKIDKPVIWTLHDMWPFCGAEHYDNLAEPGRYLEQYGRLNRSGKHEGTLDVDAWTWRRKKKHWQGLDIHFVTPSNWLGSCLKRSALFHGREVAVIPYCIDIGTFTPKRKEQARKHFNLPQDKKLILFCAAGAKRNPIKGYTMFLELIRRLGQHNLNDQVACVLFGRRTVKQWAVDGIPVFDVGRFNDDSALAFLYNAADVFVSTSTMDNLPNTIIESLSCGKPCVAFRLGGMPDMVESGKNGYLAKPFDIEEMAEGLSWIFSDSDRYKLMCRSAREKVERCYSPETVAASYLSKYQEILAFNKESRAGRN